MSRELEHNLRGLEILFTLAFNKARQHNLSDAYKVYEKNYEKIIEVITNLEVIPFFIAIIYLGEKKFGLISTSRCNNGNKQSECYAGLCESFI